MITAAFLHDADHQPITALGLTTPDAQTLTANNTTAHVPIFSIVGSVNIFALWGIVTTVLGNNTAASWRLNDGSAQTDITASGGTTLTGAAVGSMIMKITTNGTALTLENASAGRFQETAANEMTFQQFSITQKNAVATNIEFNYTTTDTPTTGAITFYVGWVPLTPASNITAL